VNVKHLPHVSKAALSYLLAIACAVLITLAVGRWWMSDAIYDDDRFAGTAVKVVEREDVRDELRRIVVNQVIEQQPDLVSARPIIETVVDTALRSKAFEGIIARAARELHRTTFETDQQSLLLNVSDVMTIVAAGVRAYDPELAERLPGGPDTGAFEVATRNTGTQLIEFDRRLEALKWVLLAGAAGAFAGSVLAGGSIRRTSTVTGITLVACAIVVWLAVGVIAEVIEDRVRGDAILGEALAAAWRIYAEGLVWWMWIQALVGMGIAMTASSVVAARPTSERLSEWRERFEAAWARRSARVVFSAGIGTLGVLMLVSPGATLEVGAQAFGLVLLYFGGAELLRGLGISRPRKAEPERPSVPGAGLTPRLLAGGGLMLAVAATGAIFWLNRDALRADAASEIKPIEVCNGMAVLCDRRIDEVVFAATHNSMGAAEEPGWFLSEHVRPIRRQLRDGVRALLIDVYYGYATNRGVRTDPAVANVANRLEPWFGEEALASARNLIEAYGPIPAGAQPALYLCHGYCELGATSFDRVAGELATFLREHPHEVVILFLQDYVDPYDVEAALQRRRLIDYVYTIVPGEPLPTLREMIEVDRRVLVLSENVGDTPAPPWYHDGFVLTQDTPYAFRSVEEFSCAAFRGDGSSPLFLLNHWISRFPPSPRDAETPNSFDVLYGRARQCEAERGRLPNMLAVNFYETGDLFDVVDALNGEQEDSER
jgi:hypothetical protein